MLATYVLETVGTQEYILRTDDFLSRLGASYGEKTVAAVEPLLSCPRG